MSQDLESIVRPFQTNAVTPAQTYYAPGQVGVPNAILRLGRGGSGKVLTGSYSYSATLYCKAYVNEKKEGSEGSGGGGGS